jgi:two-component system, LytTR family, sensor kinase
VSFAIINLTKRIQQMSNTDQTAVKDHVPVRHLGGPVRQEMSAAGPSPHHNGGSMRVSSHPVLRKVAVVWLAWTAAALFYITQDFFPRFYRNEPVLWRNLFIGWMAAMYICAAFTPAILWLGRRWPLDHGRRWHHAALHLGFGAIFSMLSAAMEAPVLMALGVFPSPVRNLSLQSGVSLLLAYGFHGGVIRYWAVIGLQAVIRARRAAEAREREALELKVRGAELAGQLTAAQLSALKMQLQPHFLFNTLGAIMVLMQQHKQQEAEAMLVRLSDLLRLVLDEVETQEVPLWRELEFLRLYLSIEQVRFQDRLQVQIAAGPDVTDALVPHMILQPIVENAVRHGLGHSEGAVSIDVDARQHQHDLVLTVSDDGAGTVEPQLHRRGVGLANTEHRLTRLYGDRASLRAEKRMPHGVRVTLTLPVRLAGAGDAPCA